MNTNNSRRNFLKTTALATLAAVNIPEIVSAAYKPAKLKKIALSNEFEAKPGQATDVYQLLVQFYPLTQSKESL